MSDGLPTFVDYVDAVVAKLPIPESFATHGSDNALTPYAALRQSTTSTDMRRRGTFFTGTDLATSVWSQAISTLTENSVVVDPACGAGDLLLPAASHARKAQYRQMVIRAGDVDDSFVRVASARLAADSMAYGFAVVDGAVADFMASQDSVRDATHVVLNPPFVPVMVDTDWAKGSVNAAAVFVLTALEAMPVGARLLALLPDVLRSGSRYELWRRDVGRRGRVVAVRPHGQFDAYTDVHVFVLEMIAGESGPSPTWLRSVQSESTVADHFSIRVGAVVPHRHEEHGPIVRFLTARTLSAGIETTRAFSGRLDSGPMVLINRTSRPGQSSRARTHLWTTTDAVAVENHLLIATPRSGGADSCAQLARVLADSRTAEFLDERIRCRHLTVSALREIPWWT